MKVMLYIVNIAVQKLTINNISGTILDINLLSDLFKKCVTLNFKTNTMALPSFFKIQQHKTFEYRPRYYDERKEKMQERIKSAEKELGINNGEQKYQTRITRGSMRGYMTKATAEKKQSNVRLLIILGAIGLLLYIMFFR